MDPYACPSCGNATAPGYLVAESFIGGAKWLEVKTRLALGGEVLAKPDTLGNVYMEAQRCRACRFIILQY